MASINGVGVPAAPGARISSVQIERTEPAAAKPKRGVVSRLVAALAMLYLLASAGLGASIVLGWLWKAAHAAWAQ